MNFWSSPELDPDILLIIFRVALHRDWSVYRVLVSLSKTVTEKILQLGHPYPESLVFRNYSIPLDEEIPEKNKYYICMKDGIPDIKQKEFDITQWSLFALPILDWTVRQTGLLAYAFFLPHPDQGPREWYSNMLRVSIPMKINETARRIEYSSEGFLECIIFESEPQPITLTSSYTSITVHPKGNIVWMEFFPTGICAFDSFSLKTLRPAKIKVILHISRASSANTFQSAVQNFSGGPWTLTLGDTKVLIAHGVVYDDVEDKQGMRKQYEGSHNFPVVSWSSVFRKALPAFG